MSFKNHIEPDKEKWGGKRGILFLPQYKFVYIKRKCEYWRRKNKLFFIFWRIIYQKYKIKYLIDIPSKAVIGKGFKIEHIGGIVINPEAILGENVTIH